MHATTGMPTTHAAGVPFRAADFLEPEDLSGYLTEVLADGDARALPLALREAASGIGMSEPARRTGLNRETLYRSSRTRAIRAWTR